MKKSFKEKKLAAEKIAPSLKNCLRSPSFFLAFGFGSGLAPKAPGTWGTLAALPLIIALQFLSPLLYLAFLFLGFFGGIILCDRVSSYLGEHDYPGIVWDEIIGYAATMFLAPRGLGYLALGFVLFRIFDIWKPYPISLIDKKIKGGLGIMLDDLAAAIPAWIILQLSVYFIQKFIS